MSFSCQQDVLQLPVFELAIVEYLCRQANSLTNCAIYSLKRAGRMVSKWHVESQYEPLDKHLKENCHYRQLFSQVAQQTLIGVCESFKSYDELLKKWFKGELKDRPKPPHYRKRGGLAGITYPAQHLRLNETIETGLIRLPLGMSFKQWEGIEAIYIPAPTNIHPERIREIRIFPRNHTFYVEYIYRLERQPVALNPDNTLGIDPGVKNWLTCVSTLGDSFIIDGKKANFWNNKVNREMGRYQDDFWSRNCALTYEKRNRRLRDYINKVCRNIADYCIANDIGTVVFGWNPGVKVESSMGKRSNQNFVLLPTAKLKERLKTVLEEIGIQFVETEEAYTSKASFLDGDSLPKHGEKPEGWKASGKRITTKLYRTAKGWLINADCNGAANILRKVATELGLDLANVNRGVVTSPRRVTLPMLNRPGFSIATTAA